MRNARAVCQMAVSTNVRIINYYGHWIAGAWHIEIFSILCAEFVFVFHYCGVVLVCSRLAGYFSARSSDAKTNVFVE